MGNTISQQSKSRKSLEHITNYVASKYIRTQNFNDMKNLSDPKYCDKLVVLTSKIIKEYLDNTTIKYLAAKKGAMGEKILKEKVLAIDKDDLDKLDVKNFSKKLHMCTGLAKHYVQVASLFASIAGTLNPIYNYKDEEGFKGSFIHSELSKGKFFGKGWFQIEEKVRQDIWHALYFFSSSQRLHAYASEKLGFSDHSSFSFSKIRMEKIMLPLVKEHVIISCFFLDLE